MHRRLPKYLLFVLLLYWAAMFIATHIPSDSMPRQSAGLDKVFHFAAYAALAFMAGLLFRSLGQWTWRGALAIFVLGALYAALDEWLQPYFQRSADVRDWLADVAGIVCGLIAFYLVERLVWPKRVAKRRTIARRPPATF
jgi:VanZ family protein